MIFFSPLKRQLGVGVKYSLRHFFTLIPWAAVQDWEKLNEQQHMWLGLSRKELSVSLVLLE